MRAAAAFLIGSLLSIASVDPIDYVEFTSTEIYLIDRLMPISSRPASLMNFLQS